VTLNIIKSCSVEFTAPNKLIIKTINKQIIQKMRKFTLLMAVMLLATSLFAQEDTQLKPVKVSKAVAFDKSIPLRDMKVVLDEDADNYWKDGVVGNEFIAPPTNAKSAEGDVLVQKVAGDTPTRGFAVNFAGTGYTNVAPPDTDGDVGPNHYMQMINSKFAIYDKSGNLLYGPVNNSTLWDGFEGPWSSTNDGDPIVMYDEQADRWIATQFAVNGPGNDYEMVAVSVTGDPTGEWYRYAFEYEDFNDYPKLGVWEDGYYCTYNMFSGSFIGAGVAVFDREAMLAGDPDASTQFWQLSSSYYGVLPADCDGPNWAPSGSPFYLTHLKRYGGQRIQVYECNVDWDTPANSSLDLVQEITPASYNGSVNGIPQPGTSIELDDISGQFMYRLQYMNFDTHEAMVMNHTVNVGGRAGIRWYELRKTGDEDWSIYQSGTFAPDDDLNRWMGSICMDTEGNIALGYSVSSDSEYPSIRYTGRRPTDPLGQMSIAEVEIYAGAGSQTWAERWGDYSCINHDPSTPGLFWYTTEYVSASGTWRTRIAAFDFEDPQMPEVDAGEDASICSNEPYATTGTAVYASEVLWETSGDGSFAPSATELQSNYIRGNQDIINGEVTLTLTATGYGNVGSVSDEMILSISAEPEADAGNDTVACLDEVFQVAATAANASSIYWLTSGSGSFNNNTIEDPIYTPSEDDYTNGVTLTMSIQPLEGCTASDSDAVDVTFQDCTGIEDLAKDGVFEITPNPANGPFEIMVKGVTAKDATITITDIKGTVIFGEQIGSYQGDYTKVFDTEKLANGVYVITLTAGEVSTSKKLVVKK
jgi:hypothetical protein